MTIADIRKLEEDREGKLNVVHLQKEGSFYHANDWSAYLMTKYPIGEALNKPMAVTAKKLKDGYIYLGIFRHTATYNLRSQLLMNERIMRIGRFDELRRKLRDRKITNKHLKTKQL